MEAVNAHHANANFGYGEELTELITIRPRMARMLFCADGEGRAICKTIALYDSGIDMLVDNVSYFVDIENFGMNILPKKN